MRADTPGHCAKYGSYTMMDLKANRVIDLQLVQSNEVGNSQHMEKEGLVRSIAALEEAGVQIKNIVTDRHPQIQKFLREEKPAIQHFHDVWHVAKGQELHGVGTLEEEHCQPLALVMLHWSCSTSKSGEETVAKWMSVANHVQDIHTHDDENFPTCLHEPLIGEDARQWLKPSTMSCEKLVMLLLGNKLLKDVEKLSPLYQTSSVEAFHSLILRFAPKNVTFSFLGMLCRLLLTAMHYNENADRPQATTSSGELRYLLWFPKYKQGDFSVRPLKATPTYGYIETLQELLFERVVENPEPYQELR
ncbi:hypothetical protein SKAU_G00095670 [Synaphobranchus kaupii]|uniref:Uncharacterized protein n=1 Tax=Synaphobranchus kaupii TaxID=118154 RepID=A0A9Q1FY52_SYNKA|nr:hypothetical protein SKAU_G00095670 [Synaphobranchus kaupii]